MLEKNTIIYNNQIMYLLFSSMNYINEFFILKFKFFTSELILLVRTVLVHKGTFITYMLNKIKIKIEQDEQGCRLQFF